MATNDDHIRAWITHQDMLTLGACLCIVFTHITMFVSCDVIDANFINAAIVIVLDDHIKLFC